MDYPRDDSRKEAARFWEENKKFIAPRIRWGQTLNVPIFPSIIPMPPDDPSVPAKAMVVRYSMKMRSDKGGKRWYEVLANGETIEAGRPPLP